jgi:hypothetical protein
VKPNINSIEVHPQLSNNKHPVDGVVVGCWFTVAIILEVLTGKTGICPTLLYKPCIKTLNFLFYIFHYIMKTIGIEILTIFTNFFSLWQLKRFKINSLSNF